jgi:hypothetical protein
MAGQMDNGVCKKRIPRAFNDVAEGVIGAGGLLGLAFEMVLVMTLQRYFFTIDLNLRPLQTLFESYLFASRPLFNMTFPLRDLGGSWNIRIRNSLT